MKTKKTKKADLRNYSFTFMLIGLVVVLTMSFKAINLKTYDSVYQDEALNLNGTDEEKTIVIKIEQPKPKVVPVKKVMPDKLKIEKDEKKVEEDIFDSTEGEDTDSIPDIEKIDTPDIEDTDIEVPFKFIENPPVFPGCENEKNKKSLKACMSKKISKFVGKEFNTEIANDLGLSGERVKIMTMFTIGKDGKVINIKTRSKYKDLAKEAKRVISKLPRMKPGEQRKRKVKVTYTLPIAFNVEE